MRCEFLFCDKMASARGTIPHHAPRTCLCEGHTASQIKWADRYRRVVGMVTVEAITE